MPPVDDNQAALIQRIARLERIVAKEHGLCPTCLSPIGSHADGSSTVTSRGPLSSVGLVCTMPSRGRSDVRRP